MRQTLFSTVQFIQTSSNQLSSQAQFLTQSAQSVSQSSHNQSQSTASSAAAVEQLTVSIDSVSQSAHHANEQAIESGNYALQSQNNVSEAVGQIHDVSSKVSQASVQIQSLSQQALDIGTITTVIKDVAEQTNLLALNAAIEAARAGDQGRGFAVVADEVRKLAERTTHSVSEISKVIAKIQTESLAAVKAMELSQTVVSAVVESATIANNSMTGIKHSAQTVQSSIHLISDALHEQKSASIELARNVEHIAQMSEENSNSMTGVVHTAQDLHHLSDQLKEKISQFTL
jgi:methyl-accepting chemotaxis protein